MRNFLSAFLIVLVLMAGCRPKPIAIDVAQAADQIAIASTALDQHTVIVAASYPITSLYDLNGAGNHPDSGIASGNILLDSALVTISDGIETDTLSKISPGLYRSSSLNLISGGVYTLKVQDHKSGLTVMANTQYQPQLVLQSIKPVVDRRARDTLVQLLMDVLDDRPGTDYYVVTYDNINPLTIPSAIGSDNFGILEADALKRVEVFSDAEALDGRIAKTFNLEIPPGDTLFVQYGRITKGYYDFLASYKRSGGILTQATAEPVTLPTNVVNGLGYFSLYDARRLAFVLRQY